MPKKFNQKNKSLNLKVSSEISLQILTENLVTQSYVSWLNEYEIMALTEQVGLNHTMESTKNYVHSCYHNSLIYFFGIFFNDRHIGNIKLGPINEKHSTAEISYVIGCREYWGQGIASKVINAILLFGFTELGLHKISASAYENNIGSIKALLKNKMKIEGTFKENLLYENKRIDLISLGVLKNDFFS